MKGGEKADVLGTSGPREQHGCEFFEISFSLIYPRLGAKEADNLETTKC